LGSLNMDVNRQFVFLFRLPRGELPCFETRVIHKTTPLRPSPPPPALPPPTPPSLFLPFFLCLGRPNFRGVPEPGGRRPPLQVFFLCGPFPVWVFPTFAAPRFPTESRSPFFGACHTLLVFFFSPFFFGPPFSLIVAKVLFCARIPHLLPFPPRVTFFTQPYLRSFWLHDPI